MRESAEVGRLGTSVLGEVENCLCDQDPRKPFLHIYTATNCGNFPEAGVVVGREA
jgi:hypothetical protein